VVQQDVLGLEVPVGDAQRVQVREGQDQLGGVEPSEGLVECALAVQLEEEVAACEVWREGWGD
jgi:hypothetical protein